MEETLRANLLELFDRHPMTPSAIGTAALRDHTFFPRLKKGDMGFNVRTFDRVVQWFSDNWPEGTEWPADVPRPARSVVEPCA